MARKTKQEAQQTREALLDAAEMLFIKRGVSKTSLQQIAQFANVTRGAVYWHFSDKLALFQALIDRAMHPLDAIFDRLENNSKPPYLEQLISVADELFTVISHDQRVRNLLDIATYKIELVDDFLSLRELHVYHINRVIGIFKKLLIQATENKEIGITEEHAHQAALGMKAMADGYFSIWIHANGAFDLRASVMFGFTTFIEGLKKPCPSLKEVKF